MKARYRSSAHSGDEPASFSTPETVALLNLAPVLARDSHDRIIHWGQGTQALYGFSPEEALGRVSHELLRTRFPLPLEELRSRFLNQGRWKGELIHTRKDGSQIVVLSEWVLQRDHHHPFAVLEINQDITFRKQDETEHATLAALVENSPDAVVGETLDGIITSWNPGAERLFGYSAPEVVGRHISLLAPPEDPADIPGIIQRVRSGQVVQRVAAERIRKDGRRIIVSLAVCPVHASDGRIIGITKIAHDITEHREAQHAVQQSEENLRTLFNSVLDGIMLHTFEGAIVDANESWCRLHGIGLEQARQLNVTDLFCPSVNVEAARELWTKALAGEPQFFEWRICRACDRSEFDVEIFLRRIHLNGQDLLLANIRDITQRKRAEEQRRLQSAALQSAANAIVITGRDGAIQSVNPAFTRLTGYSAQEVLGQNPRILKSGAHPRNFYQAMWQTIRHGQVWQGELVNKRKDGSLYTEETTITPVKDATGTITHFIAIKQDVTRRKQAEEDRLRHNQRLSILNAAAEALLSAAGTEAALDAIYDRMAEWFQIDGFIEFRLTPAGDTLELVAAKAVAGALPPNIDHLPLGQGIAGKVAQSRAPIVVANAQASDDPNLVFVKPLRANAYACEPLVVGDRLLGTLSFASSLRSSFGPEDQAFFRTLANYIALARERLRLTDELQRHANNLEQTVRERTAQLLEANSNLQMFVYTAAHDLRSPLRSIKAFSQLAAGDFGQEPGTESHMLLQKVIQSTDQMTRLLNDLLEYSKLSQAELRLEKVDLTSSADEALALLQEDIRNKGADVAVELPLPSVTGQQATVTLVITNYVANALKFVPADTQPKIRIRAEWAASSIRLVVEDNGIGIVPEHQEKLFQPFQRLHGKTAYPGTGLGLAIVRRAVERMGGQVGLRSTPGQGSCFWADLKPAD